MSSQSELEQAEKDAAEVAAERRKLEARRTELMDRIAALRAGPANAAPVQTGGLYSVTSVVPNVLDVARIDRVTLQPGMIVASMGADASRFRDRRVVFVSDEQLQTLISDNSLTAIL